MKEKKIENFLQSSGENLNALNSAINEALDLSQVILDQENKIISVHLYLFWLLQLLLIIKIYSFMYLVWLFVGRGIVK